MTITNEIHYDLDEENEVYGVRCHRSAGSICGAAEAWLKVGGRYDGSSWIAGTRFETEDRAEAEAKASKLNSNTVSMNVWYSVDQIR
jgi:hypothetical protein